MAFACRGAAARRGVRAQPEEARKAMGLEDKWREERERAAYLALEDGTVFRGVAFGAGIDVPGEAVFNTGMSGYQEIATDPSYAGQIVALTTAEVGNYGTNAEDAESRGLFLSGLVVNDLAAPSNRRSELPLDSLLAGSGVPGIRCVDTRALAVHLRDRGNQKAFLHCAPDALPPEEAVARAKAWEGLDGRDCVSGVTADAPYDFAPAGGAAAGLPLVVVFDFGVKRNILRSLASFARVRVVPARTSAEDVLALRPAGVFLSNGPGDPAALPWAAETARKLVAASEASGLPVFGICLGHQLLGLAMGAKTGRLRFGHHGCNHPVKDLASGRVSITSQNHNYAVLPETLPPELEVSHVNLNDGTVEGVRHKTLPVFSVQFHPEACPGPHDAAAVFARFRDAVSARGG